MGPPHPKYSPFQLQITASVLKRTLLATTAAPMGPSATVCEPTLLLLTEKDFKCDGHEKWTLKYKKEI